MNFQPKTSPNFLKFCHKTRVILNIKKTTKKAKEKTTLKPINKGKFNEGKPAKKPAKKPLEC